MRISGVEVSQVAKTSRGAPGAKSADNRFYKTRDTIVDLQAYHDRESWNDKARAGRCRSECLDVSMIGRCIVLREKSVV